jgi:hypothetical protein
VAISKMNKLGTAGSQRRQPPNERLSA